MSDRLPINNSLKGAVQLPTHMGTLGCWVIPPGPVCSSLCNLIIISSLMKAMLMQVLVRTPCQCELETNSESPLHTIPLNLPPSSWITGSHHNSQIELTLIIEISQFEGPATPSNFLHNIVLCPSMQVGSTKRKFHGRKYL